MSPYLLGSFPTLSMETRLQLEQDSAYNNRRLQGPDPNWIGSPRSEREYYDSDEKGGNLTFRNSREQIEMLRMLEEYGIHNCKELEEVLQSFRVSSRAASRTVIDGPNSFAFSSEFTISGGTFDAIGGNQNVTVMNSTRLDRGSMNTQHTGVSAQRRVARTLREREPEERGELSSVNSDPQYAVDASSNAVERQHHNQDGESQTISSVDDTQGGSWGEVGKTTVEMSGPNVFAFAHGFVLGPDTTLSPGAFAVVGGNQNIDII
ncbi:hypothetical protein EV361DRAFT_579800 [Lentinula raphanica]|nr:hypothetical protein EV361DRAFT_579800 [Lentinula raphanica]